jgi:hypothetical protein
MSNSIVFCHDRNDNLQIIEPDAVPHFEDHPPVIDIAIAVAKEGYKGVVFDEKQLANGEFLLVMSMNQITPEGQIIQELCLVADDGATLPPIDSVLSQIKKRYDEIGGRHE